jgi:hypothetical protein
MQARAAHLVPLDGLCCCCMLRFIWLLSRSRRSGGHEVNPRAAHFEFSDPNLVCARFG